MDEAEDWTAILSCGHPQHTRHKPPFENRPWVVSQEGRNSMIGHSLNCVRCDEFEIPPTFAKFNVTPEFTENTLPAGLKSNHKTSEGIWGKIIVLEGKLLYHIVMKNSSVELTPEHPGIIVPELVHYVEPVGQVRFLIEFYKSIASD